MTLISEVLHAPMLKLKLMSELIDQLKSLWGYSPCPEGQTRPPPPLRLLRLVYLVDGDEHGEYSTDDLMVTVCGPCWIQQGQLNEQSQRPDQRPPLSGADHLRGGLWHYPDRTDCAAGSLLQHLCAVQRTAWTRWQEWSACDVDL